MKYKSIEIDSVKGGNGDIWMRLVSFYSAAALLPEYKFEIKIPYLFKNLAEFVFGDRLTIVTQKDAVMKYSYSSLGLKDLVKPVLRGSKFISPYQRAVYRDKKKKQLKDYVNLMLFSVADSLGIIQVPSSKWIEVYQGYLEIIGLKKIRSISYAAFVAQLKTDYDVMLVKLGGAVPISSKLEIPADLCYNLIIFPTGTSRQFIPVWWAKQFLPGAYYAFFYKDNEAETFKEAGLKTVFFYEEPGDIIKLSHAAKWTISTDSFPSHLLQSASKKCTILITEVLKSRIISPVFKGKVVDSVVACHPCLHMDRKNHPKCAAGYTECLNWKEEIYNRNILNSMNL
ncbi:MAG: hypothetical protein JWR09_227 [Mucilaginibacter sp.]|nr:hypothetical protein [Mucilaginibacter sp.]